MKTVLSSKKRSLKKFSDDLTQEKTSWKKYPHSEREVVPTNVRGKTQNACAKFYKNED
jgi:hypothetical protein